MSTYVYIAGPYRAADGTHDYRAYYEIDCNIALARAAAVFLATKDIPFFCPHLNSCHFEVIAPEVSPDYWYKADLELLAPASALLLLPNYQNSKGTLEEIRFARGHKIPVFEPTQWEDLITWWRTDALH